MFNIYRAVKESRQRQEAQLTGHDPYSSRAVRDRATRQQQLEQRRNSSRDANRTTARDLFGGAEPLASTPRKLTRCGRGANAQPDLGLSLPGGPTAAVRPRAGPAGDSCGGFTAGFSHRPTPPDSA